MIGPRGRKFLGLAGLLAGLLLYAAFMVTIAVRALPDHWLAELIFYPLAGLLWLLPAVPLVRWMQAQDH
ncbi:MAG: DUF2842 domain-containing protein [Alphaproteobacteria bacterium]|nr:DUF2842 domain-containing protein [Alphaproteobacteria bacterium]